MTATTPLQRLDDAIAAFLAETDEEGALAGWTLSYQASYIEDSGPDVEPITWSAGYAISPGLSPFAAAGLAEHVRQLIHRVELDAHLEGDEEP